MIVNPRVVDIYHGNTVTDFGKAHNFGIRGVIHKAVQGAGITDPAYAVRRPRALAAGLLWGAYAFNTGEKVADQVAHFLKVAQPDAHTLMALDFEDNKASEMSLAQAVEYLQRIDDAIGRHAWLYSGNRLKTLICNATDAQWDEIGKHPLWLCEYGPVAKMHDDDGDQLPWDAPTLWQFTGDGFGPQPHAVPGMQNKMDINSFAGTDDQLAAAWPGAPIAAAPAAA